MDIVTEIKKNLEAGTVVEYNSISSELAKLQDEFGSVVPDMTSKDGYEFSKKAASICRDIRKNLEAVRKDKKQPYLDYGRLIDSQAKDILESVQSVELPHKEAYQAYDAKKKAVLEGRKQEISDLNNIRLWGSDKSESEIQERIEQIQDMEISKETFGRMTDDAMGAQAFAIETLYKCHAESVDRRLEAERVEAERVELENLRAAQREREQEDQARKDKEERDRREAEQRQREQQAAEQARIDAEQKAKEEAQRLEREKAEAEQRAKDAEAAAKQAEKDAKAQADYEAEQATIRERQRQADEQARLKAEAEAREADKNHKGAINSAVMGALIAGGLDEAQAKQAVKLIAGRKIPHVAISY